ncbi:MAG: hypothetical protein RIR70_561 [Pseudomonadota bacterium]
MAQQRLSHPRLEWIDRSVSAKTMMRPRGSRLQPWRHSHWIHCPWQQHRPQPRAAQRLAQRRVFEIASEMGAPATPMHPRQNARQSPATWRDFAPQHARPRCPPLGIQPPAAAAPHHPETLAGAGLNTALHPNPQNVHPWRPGLQTCCALPAMTHRKCRRPMGSETATAEKQTDHIHAASLVVSDEKNLIEKSPRTRWRLSKRSREP